VGLSFCIPEWWIRKGRPSKRAGGTFAAPWLFRRKANPLRRAKKKTTGFEGISTHSFRKWYATEIYKANGYDIALVQRLLQHSSAAVTQRYIGMEPQRIEKAIEGHAKLI